jgi:hypothetical protein
MAESFAALQKKIMGMYLYSLNPSDSSQDKDQTVNESFLNPNVTNIPTSGNEFWYACF